MFRNHWISPDIMTQDHPLRGIMLPDEQERSRRTANRLALVLLALFGLLILRLWFLQLVSGEDLLRR